MKKLLLLLLTTFTLSCCAKDDDKPKTELEKLPPATQIGANKAGCLVDGMAFLPKGYFPSGSALFFFYQDGKNFSLAISQNVYDGVRTVGVASLNQNLHNNIGVVFPLTEYGANSKAGRYTINSSPPPSPKYYTTTATTTGELIIT